MAIVIKPKRSEDADSAPTTSDIVDGELAINVTDKKIYIRHSNDSIVTLSDAANLTSGSTSTIDATTDIILDADGGDIFFKDDGTTFGSATNTSGNLIVKSGTTTALTFSGANVTAAGTVDSGAITSTGTVTGTGFTIGSAAIDETELEILDGATVTTTELNLLDGGTSVGSSITVGDSDGFIVNDGGTMKTIPATDVKTYAGGSSSSAADDISVGDAAVTISTSSGNITIDAAANNTDIIFKGTDATADITMLTLDGSEAGAATFNSTITGGGLLTTGGNIVIPDAGNIGSASDTDAIAIASDGVVTFSQEPVGTLGTAAQTNITSLGTLTALTVDDVAVDGKVITMTGSTSDTAVFTAGTNGTLSIVTTDDAAAAANITITADGTFEADGSTVTLDSSGDVVLDADGGDVFFKDDGTTFGSATNTSGNLIVKSGTTTALTFSGANVTAAGTVDSGAITSTGTVTGTGFTIGSAAIDETELEILDGATVTTTELNLLDGGTSVGSSITVADGDGFIVNDGGTMKTIPATDLSTYAGGGGGAATYNGIINGDFVVWQRGTSFTSGDNDDDTYTADRWVLVSAGDDIVDVTRQDGDTDTSRYSIALDVETTNKKFGIVQIIENKNCGGLGDLPTSTVSLSFKARVSDASKLDNVKAAVLSWSGTGDSVTSDVVSAWATEGTDPTLNANWTYENTPANLNVTTSWVRYKIENVSVDTAGTNNVAVFIWSDVADTTAGHILYITDVQLEPGDTANDYRREHIGTTLTNCQRYYVPSTLTPLTAYGATGVLFGMCAFPTEMKGTPTVSMEYNGTTNLIYTLHDAATNEVTWAAVIGTSARGMGHGYGWLPSNWADGVGYGHQTYITLEAEL